jgi:signal peptidase I
MEKSELEYMKDILKELNKRKIFYIITFLMFFLYFLFRIDVMAILGAMFFILGVVSESLVNAKEKGIKNEVKEILIAIAIALILWYGAIFILKTDMPFNGVVSCSMLDSLYRGDVVILYGGQPNVDEINISLNEYERIIETNEQHFVCGICVDDYGVQTPCSINPITMERAYGEIIKYDCGYCKEIKNNVESKVVCTHGVTIKGKYFDATKKEGDIIVYRPKETDIFSLVGDIIHRGIVRINVENNSSYYLIKGDNNPQFDTQIYNLGGKVTNSLVEEKQVMGKSIFSLPFLGYVKLVASGQIANPPGCETRIYYE